MSEEDPYYTYTSCSFCPPVPVLAVAALFALAGAVYFGAALFAVLPGG